MLQYISAIRVLQGSRSSFDIICLSPVNNFAGD